MRADDLVHVVIRLMLYLRDLTPPLVTNEQSYLREEPIQGRSSLENPEEQKHWVLTRRAPRSEHSNGTCDPWHARQWETSQLGGWARLHDVGCQKERWRAHCCHVLPRVSDQPASDEAIPEKGEGFRRHQPAQS